MPVASATWPALDPGKMSSQIVILQSTIGEDGSGQAETSWDPFLTTDAEIDPQSGLEALRNGLDVSRITTRVSIFFQPGILPGMRVQAPTGIYTIMYIVNPWPHTVALHLMCLAIGSNE